MVRRRIDAGKRLDIAPEWHAALLVGLPVALTMFSTCSMDTLLLIRQDGHTNAIMNVVLSVALCLAGSWLGVVTTRQS